MDWMNVLVMTASLWSQAGAPAQPAAPPPPPAFEGSAEFSYVGTSGNSDTRSLGMGSALIFRPAAWTITSKAALVRSEDSGVTKAQSTTISTQAERKVSDRYSVFGSHEYIRDRFAGISHRNTVEAGLAYAALRSARQHLDVEAGLGYANERRLAGANLSSAIGSATGTYKFALSDNATFENELHAVTSFSNGRDQRLTNAATLSATLTTVISLKVKHLTRWVRSPVPGFRKTDTTTAVALVAKF